MKCLKQISLLTLILSISYWYSIGEAGTFNNLPPRLDDGPGAITEVVRKAVVRFSTFGNYQSVENYINELSTKKERMADGRWKLMMIPHAFSADFEAHQQWSRTYSKIEDWKNRFPKSEGAAIVEATYWIAYAWHARGGGYASSVTREGWQLFKERLLRAEQVLINSKEYASDNPLWYQEYLEVALGLGWPIAQYRKLFDEAIKKEKYYYSHYFAMIRYLLPKWGGNYSDVDKFINEAVRLTKEQDGMSLYARLYWIVGQSEKLEFNLFEDSKASWKLMKQGFSDIMARYPESLWNLNNYAAFACQAGDKETFLNLRAKIGSNIYTQAWPANYSIDVCDYKFSKRV